jgi:hypothetical protein
LRKEIKIPKPAKQNKPKYQNQKKFPRYINESND